MLKLVVSTFIGKGNLSLYLNDKLILQDCDLADIELERNRQYTVQWSVNGPADSMYNISISSPPSAEVFKVGKIGKSGKESGVLKFKV